jgi:hypothetical protein
LQISIDHPARDKFKLNVRECATEDLGLGDLPHRPARIRADFRYDLEKDVIDRQPPPVGACVLDMESLKRT